MNDAHGQIEVMTDEGLQLIGEWIDDVSDVVSAT
jgi:hypothetical protein